MISGNLEWLPRYDPKLWVGVLRRRSTEWSLAGLTFLRSYNAVVESTGHIPPQALVSVIYRHGCCHQRSCLPWIGTTINRQTTEFRKEHGGTTAISHHHCQTIQTQTSSTAKWSILTEQKQCIPRHLCTLHCIKPHNTPNWSAGFAEQALIWSSIHSPVRVKQKDITSKLKTKSRTLGRAKIVHQVSICQCSLV